MKVKIRPTTVIVMIIAMTIGAIAHSVAKTLEMTFANVSVWIIILIGIAVVLSAVADSDDK